MHLYDCNGCSSVLAGSVIKKVLQTSAALGATVQARLDSINQLKRQWYTDHIVDSKIPTIELSHLIDGSGAGAKKANLHGKGIKAAALRIFMPFVEKLAIDYLGRDDPVNRHICTPSSSMNEVYHGLYSCDMFFNDNELLQFQRAVSKLNKYWMVCRAEADAADELYFQVRPKTHYQTHLREQAKLINPRFVAVYCEESLVGKIVRIWTRSISGPYLRRVQKVVIAKYVLMMTLLLEL